MFLEAAGKPVFPLGMYERPRDDGEWRAWSEAGVNLVRCGSRDDLDEAAEWGMRGWVPVPMVLQDGDDGAALAARIDSLKDHPALAVWEAPDEAILTAWIKHVGSHDSRTVAAAAPAFDALIPRLERGARVVREHDPGRKLWLNEAVGSPVDVLARCAYLLDIVGFDYYPIPELTWRPMNLMGPDTARFRRAAPGKELWIVQQAFSWTTINEGSDPSEAAYPTRDQYRFMAWHAILNGATGLLWWGSHSEDRPTTFLDDLMAVVRELADLHPFQHVGPVSSVIASADPNVRAPILGCTAHVRRCDGETLFVLINEDSHPVEAVVTGLDWLDPADLRLVAGPDEPIDSTRSGLRTHMEGHEVRLYRAG